MYSQSYSLNEVCDNPFGSYSALVALTEYNSWGSVSDVSASDLMVEFYHKHSVALGLSCLLFGVNKENLTEFSLDSGYYLYLLHMVCTTNPNLLMI